jgi:hypothetical protein
MVQQHEDFFLLQLPTASKMEVRLSLGNAFVASIVPICTILFLSRRLMSGKGDDNSQKRPAKVSRTLCHPLTYY